MRGLTRFAVPGAGAMLTATAPFASTRGVAVDASGAVLRPELERLPAILGASERGGAGSAEMAERHSR
jgi:hypothetical protein